jgi:hypothetical protein
MTDLRRMLASVPDAQPAEDLEAAIGDSVGYLGSDAALRSIEIDSYYPKWHSPWWHMVALWELGEARRIPARVVAAMVDGLNALPIKILPIRPAELPSGSNWRLSTCHCALGNMSQALAACGVDIAVALPWIKPWFVRYQMADGGLNCHGNAYLVEGECPSSMVGTIAPFEAMLAGPWTPEQRGFLERAAGCLIARQLMRGSTTVHNAEEREAQARWLAPCFPRLYAYDVLRGLAALVRWAERSGSAIPQRAIAGVVAHLVAEFPDGVIRRQRLGTESCRTTRRRTADGTWVRDDQITRFPLLDAASTPGGPSAALTRQWVATRHQLIDLIDRGRVIVS